MDKFIEKLDKKYDWNADKKYDYSDTFLDKEDIESVNQALINCGINLKNINYKLSVIEKNKTELEIRHTHKRREKLEKLQTNKSLTETQKKLLADIDCEEEEFQIKYLENVSKELTRLSYGIRTEIDILQALGHNLRKEMTL